MLQLKLKMCNSLVLSVDLSTYFSKRSEMDTRRSRVVLG